MDYAKLSSNPVIIIICSHSNTDIKQVPPNYQQNIWRCKDAGLNSTVSWEIVRLAPAYNSGNQVCQLCLEQKYQILISNCANTFNKRFKIINKCRHRAKFKLKNIKRNAI